VVNQKNLFDNVSPVWYEVNEDGSLKDDRPANAEEFAELARENQIELIPAIAMFDHELFTEVLQNEKNLNRHVEAIHREVMENEYDGIDLDYESTKLSDKDKYFEFLQKLSAKLKEDDKTLVVTVLAKWGDDVDYPYLPQTREVQDWSEIAKYADVIRIMTYDYTSASARNPGPIAPLDWMQEVIDYAKTEADPSKFVLGIHLYSYERWLEVPHRNLDPGFESPSLQFKEKFFQNTETGKFPARSYDYEVVQTVLDNYAGETEDYQGEKIYRYSKVNDSTGIYEHRVLVYIDPAGVQERVQLAQDNGLRGVAFWQLGNGDSLLEELE
jgi:spore germination protein YaaH